VETAFELRKVGLASAMAVVLLVFDVSGLLDPSGNELVIAFDAPATYAAAVRDRIGDLSNPYGKPFNFVRKMACNFGWDLGPQLTTSGLWRPVRLERWVVARITEVRPTPRLPAETSAAGELGHLDVVVDSRHDTAATVCATIAVALLVHRINHPHDPAFTAVQPVELVGRESSGPPP
jgi:hypothetical protein